MNIVFRSRFVGTVDRQNLLNASVMRRHDSRYIDTKFSLLEVTYGPLGFQPGRNRVGVVKRLAVRTGKLRRSLALHARPINLVVFQEPSSFDRKPRLRVDFTLRCFQRLFFPDLATLRCP